MIETIEEPTTAVARVSAPLERRKVGDMQIDKFAGLSFQEYREAIEFAKLMAEAKNFIPMWLKGNRGDCLGIVTQALRWRLEPYWVAQHSYVAKAEGLVTYDAAVHSAIVLSSGLLKDRPRYEYTGEGEERQCTVTATFRGETEPHEYTTPPLRQCRPAKNDKGEIRGSPLWAKDPDQQLGYFAIRNWGRRHAPELLGGVYSPDEFESATQEMEQLRASPDLLARLPGRIEGAGFGGDIDLAIADEADTTNPVNPSTKTPGKGHRQVKIGKGHKNVPYETTPSDDVSHGTSSERAATDEALSLEGENK